MGPSLRRIDRSVNVAVDDNLTITVTDDGYGLPGRDHPQRVVNPQPPGPRNAVGGSRPTRPAGEGPAGVDGTPLP